MEDNVMLNEETQLEIANLKQLKSGVESAINEHKYGTVSTEEVNKMIRDFNERVEEFEEQFDCEIDERFEEIDDDDVIVNQEVIDDDKPLFIRNEDNIVINKDLDKLKKTPEKEIVKETLIEETANKEVSNNSEIDTSFKENVKAEIIRLQDNLNKAIDLAKESANLLRKKENEVSALKTLLDADNKKAQFDGYEELSKIKSSLKNRTAELDKCRKEINNLQNAIGNRNGEILKLKEDNKALTEELNKLRTNPVYNEIEERKLASKYNRTYKALCIASEEKETDHPEKTAAEWLAYFTMKVNEKGE